MDIFSKARGDHDSSNPVDQLKVIMDGVESFLADWLQRIEQLNEIAATPDAFIRKRIHELEQERIRWEAKRNRETEEIHEKAEELAKAWLRLEQEQRRFVQLRDSQSRGAQPQATRTMPAEIPPERHDPAETKAAPRSSAKPSSVAIETTPTLTDTRSRLPSPLQGSKAGALAIEQFEQLRREIESSRRSRPA
jgi:hypothetical protein